VDDALTPEEASRLYEKYGYFLLRRCRTILRDASIADDALQQAFEKILRSGGAVRRAEKPLLWLYRVVDRCCFDLLRRRKRTPESSSDEELGTTCHPSIDIEARDAALKLLAMLSEEEMQIAVHLFIDGMSQGEIAKEVGVSRVTVNKRVRALRVRAEQTLGRNA
jgi:RNA polymerase sigma-70 factor (ECF subfamily)